MADVESCSKDVLVVERIIAKQKNNISLKWFICTTVFLFLCVSVLAFFVFYYRTTRSGKVTPSVALNTKNSKITNKTDAKPMLQFQIQGNNQVIRHHAGEPNTVYYVYILCFRVLRCSRLFQGS